MHGLGSDPDLLNQNLHFTMFLSPVTFEKHRFYLNFPFRVILHIVLRSVPGKLTGVQRGDQVLEVVPRSSI